MNMHNPPHPGEVIRDLCLEPLGLTVTDAANALGVSRKRWLCVYPRRLAQPLKAGLISKFTMTSGMQRNIAKALK
jgi:hypothetical protein